MTWRVIGGLIQEDDKLFFARLKDQRLQSPDGHELQTYKQISTGQHYHVMLEGAIIMVSFENVCQCW